MKHILKLLLSLALVIPALKGWGQITVFSDDFSTNQSTNWTTSGAIGSSSWLVTRSGDDWGARRNTDPAQLELTNDASSNSNNIGWVSAYVDLSTNAAEPYSTTLSSNIGLVTWTFNMRQIRPDPAGFNLSSSYGVAFILASNVSNPVTTGSGYAVVLGNTGNIDSVRLVRFTGGLQGTPTDTVIISSSSNDFGNEYLSIKVTYNPTTNTWELFLRNDGTTEFSDPTTGTLTSQGTAVDNTYTSISLPYLVAYWQGSTTANQTAFFDNVMIRVNYGEKTSTAAGNWNNASTWSPSGIPNQYYNVTISAGNPVTITSDDEKCNNLTIDATSSLTINENKSLTVNGTLTNNGTLTLKSDATGTGSLIHNTTGVSATVERYIAGHGNVNDAGWHLLSSPVATFNISGSTFVPGTNDDLYGWSETTNTWLNYKAGAPTQIVPGTGYLVAYENTGTKTFSGDLNVSDVSLSNLSYTTGQGNGWHLLGNPFASALEWNNGNWSLNNVAGTAKIWNSSSKSYTDILANGIIPSAQGFFVQVDNNTNGLTIPASARVHSSQAWYKNSDAPMLKLIARPTDGSSAQETLIRIEPEATPGNDPYWDSRFLAGYAPQLYSMADGVKLSTNALPSISEAMEIPLGFQKNQHNNFTIELSDNSLSAVVLLKDLKTGITHNLAQQPVYTFTSAEGDDPLRFKLAFASVGLEPVQHDLVPYAWYAAGMLHFRNVENGSWVEVYAANGQRIMHEQYKGDAISLKVAPGVYMVKIAEAKQQNVQKIVIY
ncbi:MAG: hypothetical protein PWR20_2511 [Bacteroidales bacterium]|nr:hypothetical protein [Bacteroidales bacterium]